MADSNNSQSDAVVNGTNDGRSGGPPAHPGTMDSSTWANYSGAYNRSK